MNSASIARVRLGRGIPGAEDIAWLKREQRAEPMSVERLRNNRREADYVAKRNGQKPALLQLFQVARTAV